MSNYPQITQIWPENGEGIPEATLEQKVKETVRQIGARVVEEERE